MKALFLAHRIYDVVLGTRQISNGDGREEAQATWNVDNARAMFLLSSAMEPDQLRSLLTCVTAKEMWDALSRVHEQKSASNKLMLLSQLYEYRMSPGDSIVKHVANVHNMAAKLLDVSETVSNATIMAKVLGSLSSKYAAFQTAWDNVPADMQTLENLQERLIREETRLSVDDEAPGAFAASKRTNARKSGKPNAGDSKKSYAENSKRKQRPKNQERCFKCQGKGHFARECKKITDGKKDDSSSSEPHDCVFVTEKGSGSRSVNVGKEGSARLPVGVANSVLRASKREVWLTDSGASRHITNRREWFSEYRELTDGGTVSLGDDKECRVIGEGTIKIEKFVDGAWYPSEIKKSVVYSADEEKSFLGRPMYLERL